jgi:hypothetical protein
MNVEKVEVTAVTPAGVTVSGHDIGNSSGGICTGNCTASASNGAFTFTLGVHSLVTENGLSLTVEHIGDGAAVVRIAPA